MPVFEDDSAGYIVLHHVLEHFGCGEADSMLAECRRILQPGGSLLVFVPNMWELAAMWMEGRLTAQVYMTNIYGAYMGDEADRHKWGFSPASLRELLTQAGFKARAFDWRHIEGADLARDRWILGMEAIK
jgi:predicted SAM-dependent methyltransferase